MSNNPLVRKLLNLARLTPEEQAHLDGLLDNVHSTARGRNIIAEGDRPDFVHLILKGWAARYKDLSDGRRQILAFLLPGDFCDLHVPILKEMDHGINAVTDCLVAYVRTEAIDEAIDRYPRIARALWWGTLVDEAVLRSWIVNTGRRDARERLAHLFCELHIRMRMVGLAGDGGFNLPMTQETLGDAAGLTAVHVNRTLKQLREEGAVEVSKQEVNVLDPERLRKIAGFNPNYLHLEPR